MTRGSYPRPYQPDPNDASASHESPQGPTMSEPDERALPWVRKRDGSVVAFEPAKLASSLLAAREVIDPIDAAFAAQELSQAVLHFLVEAYAGLIPTTSELAQTISQVLRQINQGPMADVYDDYRTTRQESRQQLRVIDDDSASTRPAYESGSLFDTRSASSAHPDDADRPTSTQGWDKGQLSQSLQQQVDLEPAVAREVAADVERKLLALGYRRVSAGLIRELCEAELLARGLAQHAQRRRLLGISTNQIEAHLAHAPAPDRVHHWAGQQILRRYALQEVFSPNVAGLHADGLLHLFDVASPAHWSAMTLNTSNLARQSKDAAGLMRLIETELNWLAERVEGTLVLDAPDAVFALAVEQAAGRGKGRAKPARWADDLADILHRLLRDDRLNVVLALFGRIPPQVSQTMGEGPLFEVEPTTEQHQWAHEFAHRLAFRVMQSSALSRLCRVDFHPPMPAKDADSSTDQTDDTNFDWEPWLPLMAQRGHFRVVFDRGPQTWLAEGLRWRPGHRSAVFQYVGLPLPDIHNRLGPVPDDDILWQRLSILVQSAVQAGVQKREFLRRQQPDTFSNPGNPAASMVLVPMGLDALIHTLTGRHILDDSSAAALANQLLTHLQHRLQREARPYNLSTHLDARPANSANIIEERSQTPTTLFDPPTDNRQALGFDLALADNADEHHSRISLDHQHNHRTHLNVHLSSNFSQETMQEILEVLRPSVFHSLGFHPSPSAYQVQLLPTEG